MKKKKTRKLTLRYEKGKQTKQIKNNISKSYIGLFKNLMSSALIKRLDPEHMN
jgi:DNA-directed RNA polymerase beta' subunit